MNSFEAEHKKAHLKNQMGLCFTVRMNTIFQTSDT
jgi:hypothetical protein